MKRWILWIVLSLCVGTQISAQTKTSKKSAEVDVFDELSKSRVGQGKVTVKQDARMTVLMDKKASENEDKSHICYAGYRVQVFMGNNQKKSKADALEREKKIKEKFPNLTSYLTFVTPFWKLRMGDFRTQTDALVLCAALVKEFPDIAGEVYVVKDDAVRDLQLEEETK